MAKLVPYPHQVSLSKVALVKLKELGWVYFATEERTGKTIAAILTCEATKATTVLVVTKKRALTGWLETLANLPHKKVYTVTNYHQVNKVTKSHDIVILDEAHNYISSFPKRSKLWKEIKAVAKGKPIIYISATPYAQGPQLIYNQLAICDYSPFLAWPTGYAWFKTYGVPTPLYLSGRCVESYTKFKDEDIYKAIDKGFITKTRAELGFEHEPEDQLHYIDLSDATRNAYNILLKQKVLTINGLELVCDTSIKLRMALHMLEGGTVKVDDTYMSLGVCEKINYILATWQDTSDLVIMYQYKQEGIRLREAFAKAEVLQATSYAEGVDLSMYKHLVIYSQDFSTARYTQRRARQANKLRAEPIIVHFLLVKNGISAQVYDTVVSKKSNFIDSMFQRIPL